MTVQWNTRQQVIRRLGELQTEIRQALNAVQTGDPLSPTIFDALERSDNALSAYHALSTYRTAVHSE